MSELAKYKLEKRKMKINAANAKPERPRFEEQARLTKSVHDMQNDSTSKSRKIQEDMYGELSEKWKGQKGGSSGDAFVTGLTAGLKEGSFMDDKKRSQQLIKFNEQMRDMVATQNVELFEKEKLHNAKQSMAPRIMAYLQKYKTMSPNDRKVYLQNAMDEYNQAAETDYKITDAIGSEPWKVIVSDGGSLDQVDLMEFIQTPEEQKLKYYLDSEENNGYEQELAREDNLKRQAIESKISQNQNKLYDDDVKRKEHQDAVQVEQEILQKNGDHVKFIDNMPTSGKTYAEKHIKEYTEKANQALASEKRLERAVQIAKDHPALFGNLNAIIASRYNEDPGYLNNVLKNKIPKEDLNAMSELSGIVKNIFTDSIKGVPAKGINQFIEKKIEGASPNTRWTAESFSKVVSEALAESKESHEEYKKVADYGSSGLYYRPKAKSRKELKPIPNQQQSNMAEIENKIKAIPGITDADYAEAMRRLSNGK